jgi:Family of unknown function (DUF6491)
MTLARRLIVLAVCLAPLASLAQSPAPEKPAAREEVSIPFAQFGGIDDWRADGTKALYIKGRGSNDWYYAKLFSTCQGLNFANTIGFRNEAAGDFDRFSTILVDGQSCPLTSLVKSEKPPPKK